MPNFGSPVFLLSISRPQGHFCKVGRAHQSWVTLLPIRPNHQWCSEKKSQPSCSCITCHKPLGYFVELRGLQTCCVVTCVSNNQYSAWSNVECAKTFKTPLNARFSMCFGFFERHLADFRKSTRTIILRFCPIKLKSVHLPFTRIMSITALCDWWFVYLWNLQFGVSDFMWTIFQIYILERVTLNICFVLKWSIHIICHRFESRAVK